MSHDNSWDDLLAKELAKVGEMGGKYGGGSAGARGAAWGASLAAKFLPTEQTQQHVTLSRDVATVLTQLASFLAAEGRIAADGETGTSPFPKISAVVGSGFFKMNPTLVCIEVVDVQADSCGLLVSAAAKEGLIKQRSAEKVVRRIVDFLNSMG